MTWNYRIVRHLAADSSEYYCIHEAYYDRNGQCDALTENGVDIGGDTIEECQHAYEMMAEAFKLPVLDPNTLRDVT